MKTQTVERAKPLRGGELRKELTTEIADFLKQHDSTEYLDLDFYTDRVYRQLFQIEERELEGLPYTYLTAKRNGQDRWQIADRLVLKVSQWPDCPLHHCDQLLKDFQKYIMSYLFNKMYV